MVTASKRIFKKVTRPLWQRVAPQVYSRIDKRIDLRQAQIDGGWRQHVPAFLSAISTVKAIAHELERVEAESAKSIQSIQALRAELERVEAESTQSIQTLRAELERTREELRKVSGPASSNAEAAIQ